MPSRQRKEEEGEVVLGLEEGVVVGEEEGEEDGDGGVGVPGEGYL